MNVKVSLQDFSKRNYIQPLVYSSLNKTLVPQRTTTINLNHSHESLPFAKLHLLANLQYKQNHRRVLPTFCKGTCYDSVLLLSNGFFLYFSLLRLTQMSLSGFRASTLTFVPFLPNKIHFSFTGEIPRTRLSILHILIWLSVLLNI